MTHKLHSTCLALVLATGACSHGQNAPPKSAAKLTEDQAKAIALAQYPGDVVESELEGEDGRLVFSIEIRPTGQTKGIKEVNVDAIDGSIVNVEDEDD